MKVVKQVQEGSFGIVINSFCELEQTYVEYYRKILGNKAWSIGLVSLCNRKNAKKAYKGKGLSINEH